MVTKPNKAKSKRRPTAKPKVKRARSKSLLAEVAQVRTAEPSRRTHKAVSDSIASAFPYNPALMIGIMGRLMGIYAELPARLAQCRSPMDQWLEQVRFAQRIFSGYQSETPSRAASR